MAKLTTAKLVSDAVVTKVEDQDGQYLVDFTEHMQLTVGIEASTASEARTKIKAWIEERDAAGFPMPTTDGVDPREDTA